jgi:hypothetical protein
MLLTVYTISSPSPEGHPKTGGSISGFLAQSVNRARIVKILERFRFVPATVEAHLSNIGLP